MGLGSMLLRAAEVAPGPARHMLRAYLRTRLPIPNDAKWIVHKLKQTLVPVPPIQVVRIGEGLRMRLDLSASIAREIYFHRTYEPTVAQFLRAALCPGDIVVDGGANIGELTLRCAKYVGPTGRVISVEASDQTLIALRENIDLNELSNVTVVEAALTGDDGQLTFFLGNGVHSLSSSLSAPDDFGGVQIKVRALSLATLLSENGIDHCDVLKMDVEGAEFDTLRGAIPILAGLRKRPIVVFEYNKRVADRAGWTVSDVHDLLAPLGYEFFVLENCGHARPLRTSDQDCFDINTKIDLVAR
jgi:FkbM family methyltransferase